VCCTVVSIGSRPMMTITSELLSVFLQTYIIPVRRDLPGSRCNFSKQSLAPATKEAFVS
jgi:hypothetical protein